MARVKVKLADNIARVVFIETDATDGATLGDNLFLPNGQVATPTTFAAWLGVSASGQAAQNHSQLAGLQYDDHKQYVLRSILTADGDLFTRTAGAVSRVGIGAANTWLRSIGGAPTWDAFEWGDIGGTLSNQTDLQSALDAKADKTLTLTAGAGLTGGGDLSANRTFTVGAGTGITVNADDVALSATTLASLALADSSAQPGDGLSIFTNDAGYITSASLPTGANPSATIGLSAVNGSATTFLRSDAAPALDQAIAPTWTGAHTFKTLLSVDAPVSGTSLDVEVRNDTAIGAFFHGPTVGIRFGAGGTESSIEGVDNTGSVSYQPLRVNGSTVTLCSSNLETLRAQALGVDFFVAGNARGGINNRYASFGPLASNTAGSTGVQLGASGSGYAGIGINVAFTNSNDVYNYGVTDSAGLITLDNGSAGWHFLRAGSGTAGTAISFTEQMHLDSSGRLNLGSGGSAASPAYSFLGDNDSGLYNYAADTIGVSVGGNLRAAFSNGSNVFQLVSTGSTGNVYMSFYESGTLSTQKGYIGYAGGANDYLYIMNSENAPLFLGTNNTSNWYIYPGGQLASYQSGTAVAPLITFDADSQTGFYRIGAGQLGFAEGGTGYRIGFRDIPRRTSGFARGECLAISAGVTLNTSDMAAGYSFTVYNDSASAITITQGAGVTLRLVDTATTGNRTLAARGMAFIWCNSGTEAVISGVT